MYKFLRGEGVAPELADQFIEEAWKERAAIIRQRSLMKFVVGVIAAVVCGGSLWCLRDNYSAFRVPAAWQRESEAWLWVGLVSSSIFAAKSGLSLLIGKTRGSAMDD